MNRTTGLAAISLTVLGSYVLAGDSGTRDPGETVLLAQAQQPAQGQPPPLSLRRSLRNRMPGCSVKSWRGSDLFEILRHCERSEAISGYIFSDLKIASSLRSSQRRINQSLTRI
jgi:hypothetical protein